MPTGVYKRTKKYRLAVSIASRKRNIKSIFICEICGKHKNTTPSKLRRFCSNKCKFKWSSQHNKKIGLLPPSRKGTKGNSGSFKKGIIPWNYRGISTINERIRKSEEYKLWREAVFIRDKYTCRFCGKVGGNLNADHIKPFAYFPDLRFALDNGRTLCIPCHRKTDTYGGRIIKKFKNK